MKSDNVKPATVLEVSKAFCINSSVGVLMSIDRAGSAASNPSRTVKAKVSGPIRNEIFASLGQLTPIG
jgi:hypothetical protein